MQARSGRVILALLIIGAVVLVSGVLSTRSVAEKDKVSPHQLTILFSGHDNGQVKPCG